MELWGGYMIFGECCFIPFEVGDDEGFGADEMDSYRLVARGVKAIPLQPLWCALRPGQC